MDLVSIGLMSTEATALPWRASWLTWIARRELFVGWQYAITVTLVLMVGWDCEGIVWDAMASGVIPALTSGAKFFGFMMAHQLPTLPVLVVGLNLAPRRGVRRYVWLLGLMVVMWGWCTALYAAEGDPQTNTEYAVM